MISLGVFSLDWMGAVARVPNSLLKLRDGDLAGIEFYGRPFLFVGHDCALNTIKIL